MAKGKTMKPLAITPLGDKVLIKPYAKESELRTDTGIIIPGKSGEEKHERGEVISVGKGRLNSEGKRIAPDVVVGDKVIFIRGYDYQEFTMEGENYILTSENNILAITK
jgi:chaperonin GroES